MVDKYGDGGKPILHGDGQKQHTILLEGLEYWELNNLEVTNKGEKPDPGRNGIIIYAWDKGDVHHIHLKNLTVRDVNGSCIRMKEPETEFTGITGEMKCRPVLLIY